MLKTGDKVRIKVGATACMLGLHIWGWGDYTYSLDGLEGTLRNDRTWGPFNHWDLDVELPGGGTLDVSIPVDYLAPLNSRLDCTAETFNSLQNALYSHKPPTYCSEQSALEV